MAVKINYTGRDVPTMLADLKQNLRDTVPDVNDFFESSEGRFLLDAFTGVGEVTGFVIDRQGAECYVDTVELRENLISLLKLIGYAPSNPTPELVNVTLTRSDGLDSDLVVPKYTKMLAVTQRRTIPFVTTSQVTIPTGATSVTATAAQGEWRSLTYTSNGSGYQAYLLPSKMIADGYIRAYVNNTEWEQAEDNTFVGHTPTDQVFRIIPQADKRTLIEFGSDSEGKAPPVGSKVKIEYLETLHTGGHVNAKDIQSLVDTVGTGLSVSNPYPSSGGLDFETIESARRRYPLLFKTMRRAVTLGDWEILAQRVPGVMQAKAIDLNVDSRMAYYKVKVYVMGFGGFTSDALNQAVKEYLRNRRMNSVPFDVLSPTEIMVDVTGSINVYRSHNADDVMAAVQAQIRDFFEMTHLDSSEVKLGQRVYLSRLIAAIQSVAGVASVELKSPTGDVEVPFDGFAKLRSVTMTVGGVI